MKLTSNEINVIKVKKLMKKIREKKILKSDGASELNRRLDRMEKEDKPWYDDLFPKYIALMRIA